MSSPPSDNETQSIDAENLSYVLGLTAHQSSSHSSSTPAIDDDGQNGGRLDDLFDRLGLHEVKKTTQPRTDSLSSLFEDRLVAQATDPHSFFLNLFLSRDENLQLPNEDNSFLLGNKLNLKPLIANVISTTTRHTWIQKLESYKETTPDTASKCGICNKKDEGNFVILLECIHMFCTPCIKYWFGPDSSTSKYNCPHCRSDITECVTVDSIDDVMTKLRADAGSNANVDSID